METAKTMNEVNQLLIEMNSQQPTIPNPNAVLPFPTPRPLPSSSISKPVTSHQSPFPPSQPHANIPMRNHEANRLPDHHALSLAPPPPLFSQQMYMPQRNIVLEKPPPSHLSKPAFQPPTILPDHCIPYSARQPQAVFKPQNRMPIERTKPVHLNQTHPSFKVTDTPRNLSELSSNHQVHFVNNSTVQGDLSPTK